MQRMINARTTLGYETWKFFGMVGLKLILVEEPTCETAWTDSVSLGLILTRPSKSDLSSGL